MKDYLMFLGKDDPTVIKAKEILDEGKSFPEAPKPENEQKKDNRTTENKQMDGRYRTIYSLNTPATFFNA